MSKMMYTVLLVSAVGILTAQAKLCTQENIRIVARVFGESRGEPFLGQIAVAYTILNRINHRGYPNTVTDVVYQKTTGNRYQYETLDQAHHSQAWDLSMKRRDSEYFNAVRAATTALCYGKNDPTGCATDFCAVDPCGATSSNKYWEAYNKMKIGAHWFVCRRAASG